MSPQSRGISRVVIGIAAATALLGDGSSVHAHGPKKKVTAPSATQTLGSCETTGFRISVGVTREPELEIEARVERVADPPDPVLGAWVPVTEARVKFSLIGSSGEQVASGDGHAMREAGVYRVHFDAVTPGRYTVLVNVAPAGYEPITADFPLELVGASQRHGGGAHEMGMTHPFLAHMGLPDPPGAASLRVTGIHRVGERGQGNDVAFHLEAGIINRLGLHLRNDAITREGAGTINEESEDHGTELMLMYAPLINQDWTRGLSVFIEASWPTFKGERAPIRGGAGVAGRFQWASRILVDADVHAVLAEGEVEVEYEASLQLRPAGRVFAILENRGELGHETTVYLLPAIKVGLGESNAVVGVGLQFPLTDARDYDRQAMFQLDLDF